MSAVFLGWRACRHQRQYGPAGFHGQTKMIGYVQQVERRLTRPAERAAFRVQVAIAGQPPRQLSYNDLRRETAGFMEQTSECVRCPLSGGRALGCIRKMLFPVDEQFERVAFEYVTRRVAIAGSECERIHAEVWSRLPNGGTAWHERRGGNGGRAALAAPLRHEWGGFLARRQLDSAQMLAGLFASQESADAIGLFASLWMGIVMESEHRFDEDQLGRSLKEAAAVAELFADVNAGALAEGMQVHVFA